MMRDVNRSSLFSKKIQLIKSYIFNKILSSENHVSKFVTKIESLYLKKATSKLLTVEEIVDFAFGYNKLSLLLPISIAPIQIPWEIAQLLKILKIFQPRVILEIETAHGGTLFLFCQVASDDATIISIDLPTGYPQWKIPLYKSFAKGKQNLYLLRRNSHDPGTLEEVKNILKGREIDFLFIDADHSYEGVKKDFEMYSQLVRKGGIIAFHDIIPDYYTKYGIKTSSYAGEVYKFWNQIKADYKHLEIVKDFNEDGCGIGLIFFNEIK